MNIRIAIAVSGIVGVTLGAFVHSIIKKDVGVAKTDVAAWISDLRLAFASEAASAKAKAETVIASIQKKL